jgi:hypothetical protein
MRHAHFISSVALVAAVVLSGCNEEKVAQNGTAQNGTNSASHQSNYLTVASGTPIEVTLSTALTSETAHAGDSWSGSVVNGAQGIPAGSSVSGTIIGAKAAQKGDRAMLDLGLTSITVAGHRYMVHGSTESIIAGSTRARNLGAIAGGAAAGALVGNAVSGSTKGTVIGGLVGGGAATAVVASSDGYQVVLKSGTPLTFTTSEAVAVRP